MKKNLKNRILQTGTMSVLFMLLTTACTLQEPQQQQPVQPFLQPQVTLLAEEIPTETFGSEEELRSFLQQYTSGSGGYASGGIATRDMVMMESAAPTATPKMAGAVYSQTNVQVQGVDEGDLIKTDGEYVYTITGKTLFIIKAYPGEEAKVISTLNLAQHPQGLFVEENHLAVFGAVESFEGYEKASFFPYTGMTFLNIYDVSDKEDPELMKEFAFEGNYFQSRMKDGYAYLVVNSYPQIRIDPLPIILEDGIKRTVAIDDVRYFPIPYDTTSFSTIHAIDLSGAALTDSKSLLVESANTMYMSTDNIYLTYTKYINEWEIQQDLTIAMIEPRLSASERDLIEKIKNTDSRIMNNYEKKAKVTQIVESYLNFLTRDEQENLRDEITKRLKERLEALEYMEFTIINRVSIDNGRVESEANGKLPGHLNNQFSMDEHENVLRVATTVNPRWNSFIEPMPFIEEKMVVEEVAPSRMIVPPQQRSESTNNVYTLNMNLDVLDELEGLAEGEQIFSTRFIGDKLYMVTFRQVDPFFVIDLGNPNSIRELGKLKIPGFSRYLHPYDENTIIGIGREATEEGRQQGLKISLFDVSDVKNPKEIAKFVGKERYAQSIAEFEHKAFLFSKEKALLVIPAYSYDYGEEEQAYNGAMVFKITKEEIELRGLIDHSKGIQTQWYGPGVERSLYIEELLYTKSPNLLRINEIEDLSSVKEVTLEAKYEGDMVIY